MLDYVGHILFIRNVHDTNNILSIFLISNKVCLIYDQVCEYSFQTGCVLRIHTFTFGNQFIVYDELPKRFKHWKQIK